MAKTYFIGLGGSGLKTVSELYKKLRHLPNANEDYLFTYIDTDQRTLTRINSAERDLINRRDFVDLGDTNPYQLYKQATESNDEKAKRLLEWAINPSIPRSLQFPNQKLADGAQAIRMIGRFGLYKEEPRIKRELDTKLRKFQGMTTTTGAPVVPNVWVFASTNGGTGSSLTLDILYLIDRIVQFDLGLALNPDVKLVLFMPKPFIDENKGNDQYYLNAYAYMWEINAFRSAYLDNNRIDKFGPFAAIPPAPTWRGDEGFPLFKFIIPVDKESDNNNIIPLDDLYPTVAEMVYYLNLGSGADTMISNLSNDTRLLNRRLSSYNDTRCDWTTPLIPYGYRVIRKPNDELRRYLKIRGMFELVQYGLLGQDMSDDRTKQDKAKHEFAANYILPFLIDTEWCKAHDSDSLQSQIAAAYSFGLRLNADSLEANTVTHSITLVEDVARSLEDIESNIFEDIKKSINEGTSESIHSHGLEYTKTLLHLVDDHFLEHLNKDTFKPQLASLIEIVNTKKDECKALANNLRRGNRGLCVAAFNEFKQFEIQYQTLKATISIIQKLTKKSIGYLEILRYGDSENVGIGTLIEKAKTAQSKLSGEFGMLQKEFTDSVQNAFTTIIPSLDSIAKGTKNQDWPNDTPFDEIYTKTILDYDRSEAEKIGGKHIPIWEAEGNTACIKEYLRRIDAKNTLFIELALTDKTKFGESFKYDVLDNLEKIIEQHIADPTKRAGKWLQETLHSALSDESILPKNENNETMSLKEIGNQKNIHVLYPMKSGVTVPSIERFVYVSASLELAQEMGHDTESNNEQFVQDNELTDKLIIFRMPVGLDFYSYSHFSSIESMYDKAYQRIKALQGDESGCHIHRQFNELDISMSMTVFRELTEALYYQFAIKALKKADAFNYSQLFGKGAHTILSQTSSVQDPASSQSDDPFSVLGLQAPTDKPTEGNTVDIFSMTQNNSDDFLKVNIVRGQDALRIEFITHDVQINPNNNVLQISQLSTTKTIDASNIDITLAENFAGAMVSEHILDDLKKINTAFRKLKSTSVGLSAALKNVYGGAQNQILRKTDESGNPQFAMLAEVWRRSNPVKNAPALTAIASTLTNLQ